MVTGRKGGGYRVEREILDEERLEEISQRLDISQTRTSLSYRLKNSLRLDAAECTGKDTCVFHIST